MMDSIQLLEQMKHLLNQNPSLDENIKHPLGQLLFELQAKTQQPQQVLGLRPIRELMGLKFYVDAYQRSYKWTQHQVVALLQDIDDFKPIQQDDFYCLQPIVVKNRRIDQEEYLELIDGQQRMTTLYIILAYLQHSGCFSLEYQTRKESGIFLKEHLFQLKDCAQQSYVNFIAAHPALDNIDNFHFFNAYQCVQSWFQAKQKHDPNIAHQWLNKLLHQTKVIWYHISPEPSELDDRTQAIQIFQRLNQGKISLTNAELIKALFLHALEQDFSAETLNVKQSEMANQWDLIEHTLQNPDFWGFVCPHDQANVYTRIELLFDLLSEKQVVGTQSHEQKLAKKQEYYTFNSFAQKLQSNKYTVTQLWKLVQQGFYRLSEWFANDEIYHLIGFIVGQKIKTITELWEISIYKECKRQEFQAQLKVIIAEHICKSFNEKYPPKQPLVFENLNYGENSKIIPLLLLMNIDLHRQQQTRFSFKTYYAKDMQWSLEHIHAQNSKDATISNLVHWYNDQLDVLEHISAEHLLQSRKDELKNALSLWYQEQNSLNLDAYIQLQKSYLDAFFEHRKHQLDNLCLLNKNDNSALGNMVFYEKRQKVMYLQNHQKRFIPIATQWVFAKYFNPEAENFMIWSQKDRENYRKLLIKSWEYYQPKLFTQPLVDGEQA